ncbi:DNA-methyltransferase [Prevotella lacticifex]|uniref:Methyltransferase n=1 Tax=Prevotella lacticifex TaxID=2854755 RepID=A0A9R1CX29_9BACT|nr:site-specific DNA-methyltransferase [Prevotella lacticifex]GJG35819.1 methyltransferase [Prevotella lacticifex]GJG39132.1 methyltransferase [Prevotella lacticifex]GJG42188.1 methyltransferase [Prevotella lacticifex]GJG45486.1 methyltransferase [Prevotella lacticifex]GJG48539.1 methyltransferase [Prevotella lacticifex]
MKYYNKITESVLYHAENEDILCNLPAYSFSVMITDPPYNFTKSNCRKMYKEGSKRLVAKSGLYDYDSDLCRIAVQFGEKEINAFMDQIPRLMKKMNAFIFCAEAQLTAYIAWAERHGYKFAILLWEKPLNIISKSRFSQNVEFIIRIYDNGTALNKLEENELYNRVFHSRVVTKKKHPTQKPTEIFERLIRLTTKKGDAVLDPFLGSGTTAVAAKRLGRVYVGIERDDNFFATAQERVDSIPEGETHSPED